MITNLNKAYFSILLAKGNDLVNISKVTTIPLNVITGSTYSLVSLSEKEICGKKFYANLNVDLFLGSEKIIIQISNSIPINSNVLVIADLFSTHQSQISLEY